MHNLSTTAAEAAGDKADLLTEAAKKVTLKDLFLMEHGDWSQAPGALTVKDIASLNEAFKGDHGNVHGIEAAGSCSSSSIVCCCTAAAEPAAIIII
jgi:hypothetical protein